jgi:hypothetical protein
MQGKDTQWLPVTIQGSAGMGCTRPIYPIAGELSAWVTRYLWRVLPSSLAPALLLAALVMAAPVRAQRVLDPMGDATLPRPGEVRIGMGGRWEVFDRMLPRTAGAPSRALGDGVIGDPLDDRFAGLVQQPLRRALGDTALVFTAGVMQGAIEARNWSVPFSLEVGVTRWLSVQATVPVAQPFTSVFLRPNPPGTLANLGRGPVSVGGASGTAASQALNQTLSQIAGVLTALAAARPDCVGAAPAATCGPVVALRTFGSDLTAGLGAGFGGRFVPLSGSRADTLLSARLAAFNTSARNVLGGTGDRVTARPTLAAARMGLADFQAMVLGAGFDSLGSRRRIMTGDATAGATVRLFDTFGSSDSARRAADGFRVRSALRVLAVIGTGHVPAQGSWVDQGSGTNARGVDARWTTDLMVNRRAWMTAAVQRRQWSSEDMPVGTVFTADDRTPFGSVAAGMVDNMGPWTGALGLARQRGAETTIDVVPRVILTDFLAVHGAWRWRKRSDDTFTWRQPGGSAIPVSASAARPAGVDGELSLGGSEQRIGIGLTFSTLSAKRAAAGGLPFEVSYLHQQVLSGTNLPKVSHDALQLRWYWGMRRAERR